MSLQTIQSFEEGGINRTDLKSPAYMDKTKGTPQQVDQTNTIIQSAYNEFLTATDQIKINSVDAWQVVKKANSNVGEYHDNCYETWCNLGFYFNSTGITAGDTVVVFVLKSGSVLSDPVFCGVDSFSNPTNFLNNYGQFIFTFNRELQEYHLSFRAWSTCPSTSWAVYCQFSYQPTEA